MIVCSGDGLLSPVSISEKIGWRQFCRNAQLENRQDLCINRCEKGTGMVVSFFSILAWDGALPILTAGLSLLLRECFPAYLWLAIFMPIVNVIVRAGIGEKQIRNVCDGKAPLLRQLVMVVAILALLLLDILLSAMVFDKNPPPELWQTCLAVYGGYLLLICTALWPARSVAAPGEEEAVLEVDFSE